MTIIELREKRNKAWEAAKAFAETHTTGKGTLTAEDTATYERMEQEIQDLSREIQRRERQEAMDAELAKPVSAPITGKPMSGRQEDAQKTGRASEASTSTQPCMKRPIPTRWQSKTEATLISPYAEPAGYPGCGRRYAGERFAPCRLCHPARHKRNMDIPQMEKWDR